MKLHRNARTGPRQRLLIVKRVREGGWTLAQAAAADGGSVRSKYLRRYEQEGEQGPLDRSSAPSTILHPTPEDRIQAIAALRRLRTTAPGSPSC